MEVIHKGILYKGVQMLTAFSRPTMSTDHREVMFVRTLVATQPPTPCSIWKVEITRVLTRGGDGMNELLEINFKYGKTNDTCLTRESNLNSLNYSFPSYGVGVGG